jgi:hypothetical protein
MQQLRQQLSPGAQRAAEPQAAPAPAPSPALQLKQPLLQVQLLLSPPPLCVVELHLSARARRPVCGCHLATPLASPPVHTTIECLGKPVVAGYGPSLSALIYCRIRQFRPEHNIAPAVFERTGLGPGPSSALSLWYSPRCPSPSAAEYLATTHDRQHAHTPTPPPPPAPAS